MVDRRLNRQTGFTLLEVIVALAIAALVFGAAVQLSGTAARSGAALNERTRALLVAESRLEAIGSQDVLRTGTTEGVASSGFRWQASVEPLVLPDGVNAGNTPFRLYAISVDVAWGEERQSRRIRLASVRLARAE